VILPEFSSRNDRTVLRRGLRANRAGVALAHWIIKPGSDLLLVLNRGWIKTLERNNTSPFDKATSSNSILFGFNRCPKDALARTGQTAKSVSHTIARHCHAPVIV